MGHWESNPKWEIHRITGLSQETRKSSNKQLTSKRTTLYILRLTELEKEQQIKPNVSRRKEKINTRAEINELESKK